MAETKEPAKADNLIPTTVDKNIGKIQLAEITHEMEKSYLDYAMSVIVSRALPDVRDGLKPVQRRILYAMSEMGLTHSSRYVKSAKVVGETMGKFHPHGDMAIYDTLVRMAQDFSLRYPLIDGHGNFGSVDGDSAAAMRYTEVRMAAITVEMLYDINKNTVDFIDNFDASLKEPAYLPAKLPNLLLMGADGIAVGMATKIPPHNLTEVADAIGLLIDKGEALLENKTAVVDPENVPAETLIGGFSSPVSIEELMQIIKGPDFPTGGEIYNLQEIRNAYTTGRGGIIVRAKASIEEFKGDRYRIVIHEIPYQVNKSRLIQKIANLVRDKKIKGIANLRDESDRRGMQVVIELKKEGRPKAVLNNLYKHTEMQVSFPTNMVALVEGVPQLVNLKTILVEFIKHRQLVIARRSQFELKAARARAHILEGLIIALDHLDAVIETIRKSADADVAKERLMAKFKLSAIQATAILDMQLRRLAALERQKIEDEYKMIQETIGYLLDLLTHPGKILKVIAKETTYLKDKYGDERKTKVYKKALEEIDEEDLIPNQECLITITKTGYIKRLISGTYRSQRRGGKGVCGMGTKEEDEIFQIISANNHDYVYFFTDRGRVFSVRAYDLPECSRQSKGQAVINIINIDQGEKVQTILTLAKNSGDKHLFMVTKKGLVKKTEIKAYENIRANGIIAIKLKPDDRLIKVVSTTGKDHIMLVSREGKGIKFPETDVRSMGRATSGMRGIKLREGDYVVVGDVLSTDIVAPTDKRRKFFQDLMVVMENGLGKRTEVALFPLQKRSGVGVKVANVTPKTGKVAGALFVNQEVDQILITSKFAQVIKLPLKNIPRIGRATQGVILMRFAKAGDLVASVTYLKKDDDSEDKNT
jgi:DNA gyrase subunit A